MHDRRTARMIEDDTGSGTATAAAEHRDRDPQGSRPAGGLLVGLRRLGVRAARRLRAPEVARSPRVQRVVFGVCVVVFVVSGVLSYRALPDFDGDLRWTFLLLLVVVGVPATVVINAVEYIVSGQLVRQRIRFLDGVRISLLATAANMLPIPGAAIVRIAALRRLGSSYGLAFGSTLILGLTWIGATGVIAGLLLLVARIATGYPVLGAGALSLVAAGVIVHRQIGGRRGLVLGGRVLLVEIGAVAVGGLRMFLVLLALGYQVQIGQAVALVVAGVLATAAGIVPGGLAIRELLTGAISPLVGLPAAVGLFAAVFNRLVDYAVMLPLAVPVMLAVRRHGGILPSSGPPRARRSAGQPAGPRHSSEKEGS